MLTVYLLIGFCMTGVLALGLLGCRAIDWAISHFWPDHKTAPVLQNLLIMSACNVGWLCGFNAMLAWAGLTLGLFAAGAFAYCLVRWPRAALKALFAVVVSPAILATFFISKPKFISVMTALWPHLDIFTPEGELYLRRWFMTPKGQAFHPRFLHLILLSDTGRDPHDHPGAFTTTILWNGYDEEIYFPHGFWLDDHDHRWYGRPGFPLVNVARAGDTLENPEGHTHIVKLIGPTLTWVTGWKKGKKWGFWKLDPLFPSEDRWIESEEYGEKGDERKSWTSDGK